MNLNSLSNESLLSRTRELAQQERRLTNELLHHLLEIEARKLYLELGHPSLFVYVTRELHYSEASAQRRIDAARLLRQVPALEEKLVTGELTLGSVGKAQQYFRAEQKRGLRLTPRQKQDVVLSLAGLSTREAEAKLAIVNPDAFRQERVREVGNDELAVTFTASRELRTKLEQVRQLHSHVDPSMSYEKLIEMLVDFFIAKKDKLKAGKRAIQNLRVIKTEVAVESSAAATPSTSAAPSHSTSPSPVNAPSLPQRRSGAQTGGRPALPRAIVRAIRQRDQNQCVWRQPDGTRCSSKWQVEIDHIKPYALGGENTHGNLRCLCRAHNALSAQVAFGRKKMSSFRTYRDTATIKNKT